MKLFNAIAAFTVVAAISAGCSTNDKLSKKEFIKTNIESVELSPKKLSSEHVALGEGKATFAKKGEAPKPFSVKIVENDGKSNFHAEGFSPSFIVNWADGYVSGYIFYWGNKGRVVDYNKATNTWDYPGGSDTEWSYNNGDVKVVSQNGAETVLGGLEKDLKKAYDVAEAHKKEMSMYTDMDLLKLEGIFKANRIRARKKHEGQYVTVRGGIDAIYDDHMTVCQENERCVSLWYGSLGESLRDWLAEKDQYDEVTVRGMLKIKAVFGEDVVSMDEWNVCDGHSC